MMKTALSVGSNDDLGTESSLEIDLPRRLQGCCAWCRMLPTKEGTTVNNEPRWWVRTTNQGLSHRSTATESVEMVSFQFHTLRLIFVFFFVVLLSLHPFHFFWCTHDIYLSVCVCVRRYYLSVFVVFIFLIFRFSAPKRMVDEEKKTTQPTTAGLTWISGMARTHSVNMWRWATVKNGKHTHTHIFMRANLIIAFDMWRIDKWEMIIWKLGMGSHREQTSLLCHCVATHMWLEWAHFVIILLSQQMAEYIFWWWYSNSRLDCCMLYKYPLHTTGNCWHPQLAVARERVINDSSQATECDNETNSQLKFNLIKMKQGFWFEAKVLITFSSAHKRYAFIAGHLCASIGGKCHRACTAAVQR